MSFEDQFERTILRKPEVFIYKIPPRTTNRAVKASDWGLSNPAFTGRLRVVTKAHKLFIFIEDKINGNLFAKSEITEWPSNSIDPVSDSSRYFTLKITSDDGRNAFVGMGFGDRSDSFDMNVALQDHFKQDEAEKTQEALNEGKIVDDTPKLDLSLKSGQTIKINLGGKTNLAKPKDTSKINKITSPVNLPLGGLLPPPSSKKQQQPTPSDDPFAMFKTTNPPPPSQNKPKEDDFGDFGGSGQSWVTF